MFIPFTTPEYFPEWRRLLKSRVGSLSIPWVMGEQDLCDPNLSSGNLLMLEVDAGLTIHRLERQGLNVAYYHASPGTGTRVASIDLKPLRIKQEMLFFTLVWSPQEIALYLGGADRNNQFIFLSGKGNPSKRKFRVAVDGSIIEFGNEKSTFTSIYVHENGKYLLRPTALEAWEETVSGINVLLNGEGDQSAHALFEVVAVNMTFAMLVTGLETFTKRRFLELEDEGIHPNFEALAAKVLTNLEQKRGQIEAIKQDALAQSITPTRRLVDIGRINFQSYNDIKAAFSKAYSITFSSLGVDSKTIEDLKRLISYRHQVVQVAPTYGFLNQLKVPPEEPFLSERKNAYFAINVFTDFVKRLNDATLEIHPQDINMNEPDTVHEQMTAFIDEYKKSKGSV